MSTTRAIRLELSESVDKTFVNEETLPELIDVIANGQEISGRFMVNEPGDTIRFFPAAPWPGSTEIRATIKGDQIVAANGDGLDADGDSTSGGTLAVDFRTVTQSRLHRNLLFEIIIGGDQIPSTLDQGVVPDELRNEFDQLGLELSEVLLVSAESPNEWRISDEEWKVEEDGSFQIYRVVRNDTLLRVLSGTNVRGRVIASEVDDDGNDMPLGGVTIRVDGFSDFFAATDVDGYFVLEDVPAPDFSFTSTVQRPALSAASQCQMLDATPTWESPFTVSRARAYGWR